MSTSTSVCAALRAASIFFVLPMYSSIDPETSIETTTSMYTVRRVTSELALTVKPLWPSRWTASSSALA